MQSDASKHILHDFTGVSGFALDGWESSLNTRCQDTIVHTQADLLLLACLGKVEFKERNKSLGSDTFGNVVNLAERLLVVSEIIVSTRNRTIAAMNRLVRTQRAKS